MKKFNFYFLVIIIAALLPSCTVHNGNISSGATIDCPIKDVVTGQSTTKHFLGLGGINKDALIVEAKKDLYSKYQQTKTLKLNNFSVDFKTTSILFYATTKATVSADLYDCETYVNDNKLSDEIPLINGLSIGDSIIYNGLKMFKGTLLRHTSKGLCEINYTSWNGKEKISKISPKKLFKLVAHPLNRSYFGYDIGEKGYVNVIVAKNNAIVVKPCVILGLNQTQLLIKYTSENGVEKQIIVEKKFVKK